MTTLDRSAITLSAAARWSRCVWICLAGSLWLAPPIQAQRIQFPNSASGLRPIEPSSSAGGGVTMVPINPATQSGIYPSTGLDSQSFDPYSMGTAPQLLPPGSPTANAPPNYPGVGLNPAYPSGGTAGPSPGLPGTTPLGGYPNYNGTPPSLPGAGQSAIVGTFQNTTPTYNQPGVYPNSAPSALFPGPSYGGNWYDNFFGGMFGATSSGFNGSYGAPVYPPQPTYPGAPAYPGAPTWQPPPYGSGNVYFNPNTWNPQGTVFPSNGGYPEFIRLFQGPRFRHAYIGGNNDADALEINDSDLSLAFAIPNFCYSTQPLYLLPSFSLHQWSGPRAPNTADLPPLAYSAFLDSGWQSDPARILGAELGLRVGMFSDFETGTSDSLRIQGRGIGRIRITPRATLKAGVIYLDRNKVKLLPAGGLLWQPNPDTRFDLFFPEPKLAHYLSTVGTADTWWYVGGYYGGGSWTITRDSGMKDSIDINDLRLVLGLEWGRNDQMREGRRVGFVEVGYVFDREVLYKNSPLEDFSPQDTFMVRVGFGY